MEDKRNEKIQCNAISGSWDRKLDINAPTSFSIDRTVESIDVSAELRQRSAYMLSDNPNIGLSGQLTTDNPMDVYFFNATAGSRFFLGRLLTNNTNCNARLYQIDSSGNAIPTNIYGFSTDLIQLNGLPAGEYAIAISTAGGTYGNYTFNLNVTNPAANLKPSIFLLNDLSIFLMETTNGDVYGNGKFVYNTAAKTGSNLKWKRVDEFSWGSGYEQRTHIVSNVMVKTMTRPAKYSSAKASSDAVVLLYCDEGTNFSFAHSYYQSAPDHIYKSTTKDTTGQDTPRLLKSEDFTSGNAHILVFDLNTGTVIDFYSELNIFYYYGYEAAPKIDFYN